MLGGYVTGRVRRDLNCDLERKGRWKSVYKRENATMDDKFDSGAPLRFQTS
jgi:hypothetical protein